MTEYTREEVYKAHDALEYLIQNLYDVSLEEAKDTDSYKKLVKFLSLRNRKGVVEGDKIFFDTVSFTGEQITLAGHLLCADIAIDGGDDMQTVSLWAAVAAWTRL